MGLLDLLTPQQQPTSGLLNVPTGFDEQGFQNWIRNTDWFKEFVKEYNEEPDLNTSDYDYRKAWLSGIVPERDPYDKNRYHWASSTDSGEMLKALDHPTAWKEYFMRDYGQNPDSLGITKEMYENMIFNGK
jgi:hypothetical protein